MKKHIQLLKILSCVSLFTLVGCGKTDFPSMNTGSSSSNIEITACTNSYTGVDANEAADIEAVCTLTNSQRANLGAQALVLDPELTAVAQAHARDMVERNYFSHNNPEGQSPFDRMRSAGVSYSAAAENIARGQSTPEGVVTSWMNSSGHRTNLLNIKYGKIGVGAYQGYWVQVFTN